MFCLPKTAWPPTSTIELPEGKARLIKIDIFKKTVHLIIGSSGSYKSLSIPEIDELSKAGKITHPASDEPLPQFEFDDIEELTYLNEDIY